MVVLSVGDARCRWLHDQSAASPGALLLAFALGSWATALDTTSFGALQVVGRDPGLVVALGTGRNGGTLVIDLDRLGLLDRLLASWFLLLELREVGNDPDVVEGIADTNGASEQEDVQEDPGIIRKGRA